jgi:hypothetical protein
VPKDTHRTATTDHAQLDPPEQVTVAIAELADAARESLLARDQAASTSMPRAWARPCLVIRPCWAGWPPDWRTRQLRPDSSPAAAAGEAIEVADRRVNGCLHPPTLRVALDQTIADVTPTRRRTPDQALTAANVSWARSSPTPLDGRWPRFGRPRVAW